MKKLSSILFIGVLLSGFMYAQGTVSISGKITKPVGKNVLVFYFTNATDERPNIHRANLEEDGTFSMQFDLEKPMPATFRHGRETTAMFIHPGDDIQVSLNPKNFDESIKYEGTGSGVAASNFLAAFYLKFEDPDGDIDFDMKDVIKNAAALEYQARMENFKQMKDTYFGEYSNDLSREFREYFRSSQSYKYANDLMGYKSYHAYLNGVDESTVQIPAEYYEFMNKVEVMNPDAIHMREYVTFLNNYLNYKAQFSTDAREDFDGPSIMSKFSLAQKVLSDQPLMMVVSQMIKQGLEYGNPLEVQDAYSTFQSMFPNTSYAEMLAPIYETAMRLAPGQPAPEIQLIDINGERVSLSDFREQVVYLDFWASWCKPCRAEMPSARKLKQQFAGKEVVFLYVSIDESEDAWRKAVEEENLKGVLLFAEGPRSEVAQAYNVKAIPNYFLINKDGTIGMSNPDRPSGKNVAKQINQALEGPMEGFNGRK